MINFPESDNKLCLQLLEASQPHLESLSDEMKINYVQPDYFQKIVVPLSVYLLNLPERKKPYFIGLNGGQGSGKTTLSYFVQVVLSKVSNKAVTGFSIDLHFIRQRFQVWLR